MIDDDELSQRQVQWRSRRGLLELDLLLPAFAAEAYPALDTRLRVAYARMLNCDDQDIWDWYRGHTQPETAEFGEVIERIRAFHAP